MDHLVYRVKWAPEVQLVLLASVVLVAREDCQDHLDHEAQQVKMASQEHLDQVAHPAMLDQVESAVLEVHLDQLEREDHQEGQDHRVQLENVVKEDQLVLLDLRATAEKEERQDPQVSNRRIII